MRVAILIFLFAFVVSCGDDIYYPTPEPTPEPTPIVTQTPTPKPTPTPEGNPVCSQVYGTDGGGGFLWKPVSESNKNLVILFPGRFQKKFDSVTITRKDGTEEKLVFSKFSNPDPAGLRQTWRAKLSGSAYKNRGLIVAREFKQTCTWKIPGKSGNRYD